MLVLMLVMLVNALSYGTIIPLLYPYASKFGIDATGLGLLMATYSVFQFLATPLIGRLSDRYGRKPLLLLCLVGTSISLALFASAQSLVMLFVARILDGITGGNNSVAQAVIADTVKPEKRAKSFGLLGAAFGFGFLIGPAVGGLLSGINLTLPFWFASGLALFGSIFGLIYLPETNKTKIPKQAAKFTLIDWRQLAASTNKPIIGSLLIAGFLFSFGQNMFVIALQLVTVDVLRLTTFTIGMIYAGYGLMNILMQAFGIRLLLKFMSPAKLLSWGLLISMVFQMLLGISIQPFWFLLVLAGFTLVPPLFPLFSSLISVQSKPEEQGLILGVSQSYISLGQIVGPIAAGFIGSFSQPLMFFIAGVMFLFARIVFSRSRVKKGA